MLSHGPGAPFVSRSGAFGPAALLRSARCALLWRELLWVLLMRDIRARYTQSALGFYWAVVEPLIVAGIFTLIFSTFVRVSTGDTPYTLFLLAGLLSWNLFSNSALNAVNSVVREPNLITKVYFPRELLPIAATMARVLDLAASLLVLIGLMVVFGRALPPTIGLLPLVVLCQIAFCVGIGLMIAAANVFYRDVGQLTGVALMIWMYLSALLYPLNVVPAAYLGIFLLNPMVGFIEAYRKLILLGTIPDPRMTAYTVTASLVALIFGYAVFKRCDEHFADFV